MGNALILIFFTKALIFLLYLSFMSHAIVYATLITLNQETVNRNTIAIAYLEH